MNEFTFNCRPCGQPIVGKTGWLGRQMNCPSCNTRITIAVPSKALKKRTRFASITKTGLKRRGSAKRPLGFP